MAEDENTVAPAPEPQAPAEPPKSTHKPECGEVGDTGAHGDLGSNKA